MKTTIRSDREWRRLKGWDVPEPPRIPCLGTANRLCQIKQIYLIRTLLAALLPIICSLSGIAQVYPSIEWQKTLGGSGNEKLVTILPANGGYLLVGTSDSPAGYEKTQDAYANAPGESDFWVVKINTTGQKIWDRRFGGTGHDSPGAATRTPDGGFVIVGITYSPHGGDISDPPLGTAGKVNGWALKIDANGDKVWDTRLGDQGFRSVIAAPDGGYLAFGYTAIGFTFKLVKLNANGQKMWEKVYGGVESMATQVLPASDGGYILVGSSNAHVDDNKTENGRDHSIDYWVLKVDESGNRLWDKTIGGSGQETLNGAIQASDGGYLLFGNSSSDPDYDKSSPALGGDDYWLVKIDVNGNKLWDRTYGNSENNFGASIARAAGGGYFLVGTTFGPGAGDQSEPSRGQADYWILKITETGLKVWDKTLGGNLLDGENNWELPMGALPTTDGGLLVGSASFSGISGDKTESTRGTSGSDMWIVKLGCGFSTEAVANQVNPSNQTACILGIPEQLVGTDDDAMYPDLVRYQWQRSPDGISGWTDIAVGITKDYLPEPSSNTVYYRRIALWECHADTSNVAVVAINGDQAPVLDMAGTLYTCAGSPISLGNTPPASGGMAPYIYSWDNANYLDNAAAANPVATLTSPGIFTLTVTDAKGCKKIGQVVVNIPPSAVAGPDMIYCPGTSGVRIGTPPLVGFGVVSYSWSPATGLNSASIAQPVASPSSTTTYTLTTSFTNSDGVVCTTTDDMVVTVTAPPTSGFAGPDVTICSSGSASLGTLSQPGYSYTWSPGLYLERNDEAQVTFDPGTPFPPVVDPITYTVTATNGTCTYSDQVEVTVIQSNAGLDGCGPRTIGTADLTANVSETYSWTRLGSSTGTGNFTGAIDQPQVLVSATTTGEDIYQLTVSHGGTSCISTVRVPVCGNCGVDFVAEGGNCLIYNGKPLKLIADDGGQAGYNYTWNPSAGLSSSTGSTVYLLDGVNRNYTLTKTRSDNPSDACSITKAVNPPAASFPIFSAQDVTACEGTTVTIGQPPVSGYTYIWNGPNGFASSSSNPSLTMSSQTAGVYTVRVEDTDPANEGGCFTQDTVRVALETLVAPQVNWTVCENAIIKLGAPDPSGGRWTYNWSPSVAAWQNGTGPASAEPEVLITANTTFSVTVTNETGCSATGNSTITVTNSPTLVKAPDVLNACAGSNVQIGSPALPGVLYSWSPAAGLSDPNVAQPIATVAAPGSSVVYTVTATFPGTCSAMATSQVTVSAFDAGLDLGGDITYCPADGPVQIGNNAPTAGVISYSWSPATGLSSTTISNPTTSVTVPTEYTLSATYSNGCVGLAKVKVIPASTPDAGLDRTVCFGSSTVIGNMSNQSGSVWSGTGAAYLTSTTGSTAIFNADGTAPAGTYFLTVSQSANGCTNSDQVMVTVSPPVSVSPGAATLCLNGTRTLGQPAQPGYSYSWSPATGLSSPGSATTQVTLNSAGTYIYTLFVTNNATGCGGSAQYVVKVSSTGAPDVVVPDVTACWATPFPLQASVSPSSGNYSYEWSPAAGLSDPFVLNPTATVNSSRSYTLLVTDNASGCSGEATGNISVADPTGNYITSGPQNSNACANSSVTLQASLAAGYTYSLRWQKYNLSTSTWEDLSDGGLYAGVTTTTLQISNNATLNGARYRLGVATTTCGVIQQSSIATLTVNQCLKSSIGDWVWDDVDRDSLQDANEPGVAAVSVTLYRNGTVVATTTTDMDGYYLFDNLDAFDPTGNAYVYRVGFADLPTDYIFTGQGTDAGSNGAGTPTDSDVDPNTGLSRLVTLTYGQHLTEVDAGVHSSKPMPVTLVSFNATGENNTAILVWSTSWESNSEGFEIQRSQDAIHWVTIGNVAAQGESSTLSAYTFNDMEPMGGSNYYRLRMVDQDRSFSFSRIVVVDFGQIRSVVSPNPASQRINLTGAGREKVRQVRLTSQTGNEYFKGSMPKDGISLDRIQTGVYLLRVEYNDGAAEILKVLVLK